ncbi:MAG: DNA-3-methyladenine glycosylase 2 family protein [Oscillospiraceae bacterium]|nr:DNA-3-methyladenine glycosylase 2 family protein [Oscillospiraceae bacterium]
MNEIIYSAPGFSLADTLDCGQCFRCEFMQDGSIYVIADGKAVMVGQDGDKIVFRGASQDEFDMFWHDYFDFGTDYGHIKKVTAVDDTLKKAFDFAGGIHILKQHPWETLVSFIISQNNNIPRIKGIISRLCENLGQKHTGICGDYYAFPDPASIVSAGIEGLACLKAGFRAKYILDAADKVANGQVDLSAVKTMDTPSARSYLMQISGVGPKVAECVLLFGFYRLDAFPVDVWIKRALDRYYPAGFPPNIEKYKGIAQQWLFHYIRNV